MFFLAKWEVINHILGKLCLYFDFTFMQLSLTIIDQSVLIELLPFCQTSVSILIFMLLCREWQLACWRNLFLDYQSCENLSDNFITSDSRGWGGKEIAKREGFQKKKIPLRCWWRVRNWTVQLRFFKIGNDLKIHIFNFYTKLRGVGWTFYF